MMKKVLSVVLALVLTLGVCAFAASAVTVKQLETILQELPSEFNAHFYKDATEANILEARAAAEAALESGDQAAINAAYAKCQDAWDEAYYCTEVEWNEWGDTMWVYHNRDESKAIATFYYDTTAGDTLKPGDTFDITVSLKTNFPIRTMTTSTALDRNVFEYVPGSAKYNEANTALDLYTFDFNTHWGYDGDNKWITTQHRYPTSWDQDMIDQYQIFTWIGMSETKDVVMFYPREKTELYTYTVKVKDDAEIGSTGKVFANNDFEATFEQVYLTDDLQFFMPTSFCRAYGEVATEYVADLEGEQHQVFSVTDEHCNIGQTIYYEGDGADKTITIVGDEPEEIDYSKLEAAIAEFPSYDRFNYTEDSYNAYADAVEAGKEGLTAETQAEVDAFTKSVTDARDALVIYENESEIISITEKTAPQVGSYITLDVLVSKPVKKIQFVDPDCNTYTYYDGYSHVLNKVANPDGTETWTIEIMVRSNSDKYDVAVKNYNTSWSTKSYRYAVSEIPVPDSKIISYEIPDAVDGRLKIGRHNLVVTTGADVTKLQVSYLGTTTTFTPSSTKANVETVDGKLVWTLDFNFSKPGNGITYEFSARTVSTSWEKSTDVVAVVDVLR